MKKTLFLSVMTVSLLFGDCPPKTFARAPDKVLKKAGWELRAWLTGRGTRSLGIWYRLYHNGKEVCPVDGNRTIVTPLGKLIYKDNPTPFDWHGWTPVDDRNHMLFIY
ncbi:hypothetical protein [Nitratifractor sp.]